MEKGEHTCHLHCILFPCSFKNLHQFAKKRTTCIIGQLCVSCLFFCYRQEGDFVEVDFVLNFDRQIPVNEAQKDVSEIVFGVVPRVRVNDYVGNEIGNTVVYFNSTLAYTDLDFGRFVRIYSERLSESLPLHLTLNSICHDENLDMSNLIVLVHVGDKIICSTSYGICLLEGIFLPLFFTFYISNIKIQLLNYMSYVVCSYLEFEIV